MRCRLIKLFLLGIFILVSLGVNSQSILGEWKTIDDINGNPKSILEIYTKGGRIYGKVQKILEKGKENAKCIKCSGELKDKPVVGMLIIDGLINKSKNEYSGGEILDPENVPARLSGEQTCLSCHTKDTDPGFSYQKKQKTGIH